MKNSGSCLRSLSFSIELMRRSYWSSLRSDMFCCVLFCRFARAHFLFLKSVYASMGTAQRRRFSSGTSISLMLIEKRPTM